MIIVIEGADGAGKTTLARALMRHSTGHAQYIHATRPEKQWPYATDLLHQAVDNELRGCHTILDRHWVSDNIYYTIDPNEEARSGIHVRRQDSVLGRFGAYYILCAPDAMLLMNEYTKLEQQRPEMWGKKYEGMFRVMQKYRFLWFGLPGEPGNQYTDQMISHDPWTKRPLTMLYDRFNVNDIEQWARSAWQRMSFETQPFIDADPVRNLIADDEVLNLSGSLLTCQALLVGERAGRIKAPMHWPFYSNKGSSAYLTSSLHEANIWERDVALVNAYSTVNMSTKPLEVCLRWLKAHRPEVKVIALGKEATYALDALGHTNYVMIPHPQWARRFNHNGNYHMMLRSVIYGGRPGVEIQGRDVSPVGVRQGGETSGSPDQRA